MSLPVLSPEFSIAIGEACQAGISAAARDDTVGPAPVERIDAAARSAGEHLDDFFVANPDFPRVWLRSPLSDRHESFDARSHGMPFLNAAFEDAKVLMANAVTFADCTPPLQGCDRGRLLQASRGRLLRVAGLEPRHRSMVLDNLEYPSSKSMHRLFGVETMQQGMLRHGELASGKRYVEFSRGVLDYIRRNRKLAEPTSGCPADKIVVIRNGRPMKLVASFWDDLVELAYDNKQVGLVGDEGLEPPTLSV